MSNEQESNDKPSNHEPAVKPGLRYYLTRPETPAAIKIATLRPQPETK